MRTRKNPTGTGVKPSSGPSGENGSATPTATTASVAASSAPLGLLRRNGTRRVRIAKITSDCVASDSMNQPVRNSSGPAWNSPNMIANVRKSNSELIGPNTNMNRRMEPMSLRRGAALLVVDPVGGDGELACVVEQVVEQDLRREHRQERQQGRGGRGAEHVAEVARRPVSTYFIVFAKTRRLLATSVAVSTDMPTSAAERDGDRPARLAPYIPITSRFHAKGQCRDPAGTCISE